MFICIYIKQKVVIHLNVDDIEFETHCHCLRFCHYPDDAIGPIACMLLFICCLRSIGMLSVVSQLDGRPYYVCADAIPDHNPRVANDYAMG